MSNEMRLARHPIVTPRRSHNKTATANKLLECLRMPQIMKCLSLTHELINVVFANFSDIFLVGFYSPENRK